MLMIALKNRYFAIVPHQHTIQSSVLNNKNASFNYNNCFNFRINLLNAKTNPLRRLIACSDTMVKFSQH